MPLTAERHAAMASELEAMALALKEMAAEVEAANPALEKGGFSCQALLLAAECVERVRFHLAEAQEEQKVIDEQQHLPGFSRGEHMSRTEPSPQKVKKRLQQLKMRIQDTNTTIGEGGI
jgi:hypothetical protein